MKTSILSLAAAPALALAQTTHDVDVGENGLVFEPDTLTAAQGDLINFHFYNPGQHSVASSTYMNPCIPSGDDAIFSGYIGGPTGESPMVFQVTVNNTDPLWLYCATNSHCQLGMAMVVNPPAQGMDLQTYINNAKQTESDAPADPQGGVFINASPDGSSTTSSGAPSSSTSSAAASSSSSAAAGSSSSAAAGTSSSGAAEPTSSGATSPSGGAGGAAGSPSDSPSPPQSTGGASSMQAKGVVGALALGLFGAMVI